MELPLALLCATIGALIGASTQETDPATLKRELSLQTPGGAIACLDPDTARIRLRVGEEPCSAFERSPDGLWLARLLYSDTVVVHDTRNGTERARFEALPFVEPPPLRDDLGPPSWGAWWTEDRELRFAGAGDRLVLAKGHRATELWSLDPTERVAELLQDQQGHATALDVSSDGSLIVTGDESGQVILWSAVDGARLHEPWRISTKVTALHFDPSGLRIAIGSVGCNVHLLELDAGTLQRLEPSRLTGTGYRLGLDDVRFDPSGQQLIAVTSDCTPNVMAWVTSSCELMWERDLPWTGRTVRHSTEGERWLLGGRGVWLDARTGATLCEAFPPFESHGLQTNGDVAWRVEGDLLRLFTLDYPVRIRDVRLGP